MQAKVLNSVQFDARRKALAAALRLESVMGKTGSNPVQQVLLTMGDFFEWQDYPDGGVWDRDTGYGYFYHAHPGPAFPFEHGHFHLFWANDPAERKHLAALSMDRFGRIMGAFAPNIWHVPLAQDETAVEHYERFELALAYPCFAANQWLGAAVRALAPRLARLHRLALKAASDSATVNDRSQGILATEALQLDAALIPQTAPQRVVRAR